MLLRIFVVIVAFVSMDYVAAASDTSEEPRALSLESVYQLARRNATDLNIARYRVDSALAQRGVARSQLFPQLSAFGQWSDNRVEYDGPVSSNFDTRDYPGERYGVQFRQSLFNVGNWKEYERQTSLHLQSKDELDIAETQVLAAVTKAYLDVLLADAVAKQLLEESTALRKQVEEAEAVFERGFIPITQVLETKTRAASISAELIDAKGRTKIAREQLYSIIGERNINPLPASTTLLLDPKFNSAQEAAEVALANNPVIAAALDGVEAARDAISREKGSWLPDVDVVFTRQYSDVGFDNLSSPPRTTETVQIAVNYPIFEGGASSSRLRGAWAEFYSAKEKLEAAKREAESRARSSWFSLEAAIERVEASQQGVMAASTNLDASQKAVRAGTGRVTDVLLALAQKTQAQNELSGARFQVVLAWLELELSTGGDPIVLAKRLSDALTRSP